MTDAARTGTEHVVANGVTLAYAWAGNPDAPPMVLLHGNAQLNDPDPAWTTLAW